MHSQVISGTHVFVHHRMLTCNRNLMNCLRILRHQFAICRQYERTGTKNQRPELDRPRQLAGLTLLQLPINAILTIAYHLPLYSLCILSLTCFPMRMILQEHFLLDYAKLSAKENEVLQYIYCMSREKLDRWPCSACLKLHRFSYDDLVAEKKSNVKLHCPIPFCLRPLKIGMTPEYIHSAHVHLALKFTRSTDGLGASRQKYLQRLLETRRGMVQQSLLSMRIPNVFYAVEFRIINGRFLQRIQYRSHTNGRSASSWLNANITYGDFCPPHWADQDKWFDAKHRLLHVIADPNYFSCERSEISASCPRCATDVLLQRTFWGAMICVWKDLGTEAPSNRCWRAQITDQVGFKIAHGSARQQYESGKHSAM